jgi:hypothetical protein
MATSASPAAQAWASRSTSPCSGDFCHPERRGLNSDRPPGPGCSNDSPLRPS